MNLFLMRHCTAEPHPDEMRDVPLTPLGKAEARLMGRWLRDTGYTIDLVISSPLQRAHQTAKRVANRSDAPLVACDALTPLDDPETAWKAILAAAGDKTHIVVVTHGPLIQSLRDWIVGNPGTSRYDQHWAFGCVHHLKDGREHWAVAPHLVARERGEQAKIQESGRQLVENLKRANKAAIVDPLIRRLTAATKARFRAQAAAVKRAIRGKLAEADSAQKAAAASAAALAAFHGAAWLAAYRKTTAAAYSGGAGMAAGMLDANEPDDLGGWGREATDAAAGIDRSTLDRVLSAIGTQTEEAGILAAVSGVFSDAISSRADTIGLTEISSAFHGGMTDSAASVSADTGDDVEKHWDAEDDACDDCLDCDDEGWVDLDFTYPAFGVDEPEGHPNCRCSLDLRRAAE